MARIKLKDEKSNKLIGQAIFQAWDMAHKENPKAPTIDRRALLSRLSDFFDLEDTGRSGRRIEFDVVFDSDLDANTRLVWISIPTPETEGISGGLAWDEWKRDYYDNLPPDQRAEKEEQLGKALLFGCGR